LKNASYYFLEVAVSMLLKIRIALMEDGIRRVV